MRKQVIRFPRIRLRWSGWVSWDDLKNDARGEATKVPSGSPGVYEVKYRNARERLAIGKASNLRKRVERGLVRGKMPHSAGKRIRAKENTSKIVIRWAITDRPAAVEEELHRRHRVKFGKLPKYTRHT